MKKTKKILTLILIITLLGGGFLFSRKLKIQKETSSLKNNIEKQIENISEIATIKYNYTDIIEYKNNLKLGNVDLPFTGKSYLVKYSGYIKAGTDLSKISYELNSPKKITIYLPEAEILDNVIEEEEVYFYNEKDSAFNRLKFDDVFSLLVEEKKAKEKEVIDKGILNDARENVKNTIVATIGNTNDVEIDFQSKKSK